MDVRISECGRLSIVVDDWVLEYGTLSIEVDILVLEFGR